MPKFHSGQGTVEGKEELSYRFKMAIPGKREKSIFILTCASNKKTEKAVKEITLFFLTNFLSCGLKNLKKYF